MAKRQPRGKPISSLYDAVRVAPRHLKTDRVIILCVEDDGSHTAYEVTPDLAITSVSTSFNPVQEYISQSRNLAIYDFDSAPGVMRQQIEVRGVIERAVKLTPFDGAMVVMGLFPPEDVSQEGKPLRDDDGV